MTDPKKPGGDNPKASEEGRGLSRVGADTDSVLAVSVSRHDDILADLQDEEDPITDSELDIDEMVKEAAYLAAREAAEAEARAAAETSAVTSDPLPAASPPAPPAGAPT